MNTIIIFLIGLFVGGATGVLTMGLVQLNHLKDCDRRISLDR